MKITCKPIRFVYNNPTTEFRVIACDCVGECPPDLELNNYGNFTIAGSNLLTLSLYNEYSLEIRKDHRNNREASYVVVGFAGLEIGESITVDPDKELSMLQGIMSYGQASNVHEAYPDFIQKVLNNQEAELDFKKIYGVGPVYLESYIDKIKSCYKSIFFQSLADDWDIRGDAHVNELIKHFLTPDEAKKAIDENPYAVFVDIVNYGFETADKKIIKKMPHMIDSPERCVYGVLKVLKDNESEGDTRIGTKPLANMIREYIPECAHHVADVVKNHRLIHHDPETKTAAIEETFKNEETIAWAINERVHNPVKYEMDYEKFREVDGFNSTDEQLEILKLANEKSIALLTGGAGCVDADTEFFNGKKWKRIADYIPDDYVLQYKENGDAELVKPIAYVKKPCNKLWHFETKRGINQTVCDEHRIIYESRDGVLKECNINQLKENHLPSGKTWNGFFLTTFNYESSGIELSNAQIRLMCAVIADGSFNKRNKNSDRCNFHIKKERKKERLRFLFKLNGLEWVEHNSKTECYTDFYVNVPRREKIFSRYWYNTSMEQRKIIIDEIIHWDGCVRYTTHNTPYKSFSTSLKENADFIQFAASSVGIGAHISVSDRIGEKRIVNNKEYTRKTLLFNVNFTNRTRLGLCSDNRMEKTPITQVPTTDGFKYCFTVSSSMLVLRRNNCIFVTGNCGKTASVKNLIFMLEHYMKSYLLVTPTGISAKRLKESTGRPASTIHMFLAREGYFSGDYLIIDEISMCAVDILANLFTSISPNTKIIMIGDAAQLASISCGNVLQDILNSGLVPRADLTKVFRYGVGAMATVTTDIRNGKMFLNENGTNNFKAQENDYTFIPIEAKTEKIMPQIIDIYEELLESGYKTSEIMVLSPFNKGELGTYAINSAIQNRFNSHVFTDVKYERDKTTIEFKVGDKVVNTKNNYRMPVVEEDEDGHLCFGEMETPIMNGDIGYIRDCVVDENLGAYLIVQYDNALIMVGKNNIPNLLLGYSLSIHRVQGAQAKAVVVLTAPTHKDRLSRNLLYVGVSRAQKKLIQITNVDIIEKALEIEETKLRDTWLKDLLIKFNDEWSEDCEEERD